MPNGHFQGHKQIEKKQYNGLFKGKKKNILKRSNKTAFLKAKTYWKEAKKKNSPFIKGHIHFPKRSNKLWTMKYVYQKFANVRTWAIQ